MAEYTSNFEVGLKRGKIALKLSPPPPPEAWGESDGAMFIYITDAQALKMAARLREHVKWRKKYPSRVARMAALNAPAVVH